MIYGTGVQVPLEGGHSSVCRQVAEEDPHAAINSIFVGECSRELRRAA